MLRCGYKEVAGYLQTEDIGGEKWSGASAAGGGSIGCCLRGIASRETLEDGQAGHKGRVQRAGFRKAVRIGRKAGGEATCPSPLREKCGEAAWKASTESNWQEGSPGGKLTHGAHVFAD